MAPSWTRLIRFIAEEDGLTHLGEVIGDADVGLAHHAGQKIQAKLITGSAFDGVVTDKTLTVARLLCPLDRSEVPLIRCLGLNYHDHAKEANMPVPEHPVLFIKPRTALAGPHPAKISIPKFVQDGSSDYEAELTLVVAKDGRDIQESKAMDYVLGYTVGNDVSARTEQFRNSQWCFSKGLDNSAPIGPVIVSPSVIKDPQDLAIKATLGDMTVQDSHTREMIFSIPKTLAFLSQGTTLERGTVIMLGTPPGVGAMRNPKVCLKDGDDMRVYIDKIGTLINEVHYE
ncbi:fumarylacetoacetate hydrolase domain-containing protein 2A [Pyricularia oryzae 70-15]|uniref:Fumarylacetoacetate hydrolase domain-containing protein 2A n=1 Tax=Pyricularia oryzae (strain 70-15 / ATCC MYA-4617 / FGSC 8958) TaxID=242507 RepID=G4N414_PYRO7|nr:fumarylacetoacetate hydrolase domain-containing protein 2A [Pyricularia oryzae 70-15]EHA51936.1 fumarylacetoacetate hydrolase domain-containing protein 2A [Pyricularia oryzae 70-15]KAI7910887.1 fumarylacetoacetate hydrolase domain-containing protein 2A [Pyricularia oryzae]KAI7914014.1 fumarylacetoacetate hydrolase domain-containing protein 2A [Pyricularia oryzae]